MKKQPTEKQKKEFITQLAIAESPDKPEAHREAARARLDDMIKEFDCGCGFRDQLFKMTYQAARKKDFAGAVQSAKLFTRSFRYDSLHGLLKGLTNG